MTALNTSTSSLVFYRKDSGLTQSDVAIAMSITQSAVARLEQRLLSDADVTFKTLERYADALGISIHLGFKPKTPKKGLFASAKEVIEFAVHSSACEGMTTPPEDIENLWRLARGEISAEALINKYIDEAIEEDSKLHER